MTELHRDHHSQLPGIDALRYRFDPKRLADEWQQKRTCFLVTLAASPEPLDGEEIARRAGEVGRWPSTASHRLDWMRRRGYVEHAGHDRLGRVLWGITPHGRALLEAV